MNVEYLMKTNFYKNHYVSNLDWLKSLNSFLIINIIASLIYARVASLILKRITNRKCDLLGRKLVSPQMNITEKKKNAFLFSSYQYFRLQPVYIKLCSYHEDSKQKLAFQNIMHIFE